MGNSESFDLINIPENPQSNPKNKNKKYNHKASRKRAVHHHHSQTISSSLKSITSFDLNGIFRKINEEQNTYHPEKKSAAVITAKIIASAPPLEEPLSQLEEIPITATESSSESESSNYIERKIQEVEDMTVPVERKLISVTLTKGVDNSPEMPVPESIPGTNTGTEQSSSETSTEPQEAKEEEKTEVVIVEEIIESEDMINLDNVEPESIESNQKEDDRGDIEAEGTLEPVEQEVVEVEAKDVTNTDTHVEYESEIKIASEGVEAEKSEVKNLEVEEVEENINKCTI